MRWQKAGEMAVDSGQIALIDPAYMDSTWSREGESRPQSGTMNFDDASRITMEEEPGYGGLRNELSHYDMAFVTHTRSGDGVYPVYVERDVAGRVVAVQVRFDGGKP